VGLTLSMFYVIFFRPKPRTLKGTSNNYQFVTPAPYQVRGKLRRESSDFKSFWIPAGVYPDENRGRNDIIRGSLNLSFYPLSS